MTHQVLDSRNAVKHEGSLASCQAWMRRMNAGFYCKIVPAASKTPLEHQLRECLAHIKK
jgi:hypothetical protein